ncbi:MAG: isoleucine--tRNA ligase [Anaerolineaceae bacterium]|nr:isoleucine--tRNA ligase [Anaerolineaceae bacterium]
MFRDVNARVDIQRLEQEQLDFWRDQQIFQRTMDEREGGPGYVFYEGPPTANGKPGSHHVLSRAFKDMFPRYKTMQGYYCLRRSGWDTHGLPVEIEVQKELGLRSKEDIESYGVAAFNDMCRASVQRYITDWEQLTERIAFWADLDNPYITFTNDYIESVWWILRQLWDKGLIYRGHKVVPYSPSSGTPLSSHEVSLGYKTVTDPSVFVRFRLKEQPDVSLLAWTTTPWTLPGNAVLAVGEDIAYVQVEGPDDKGSPEQLILAEKLLAQVLVEPERYQVVRHLSGSELVGLRYEPLYSFLPAEKDHAYVVTADFVSTDDGTGIVHVAPAYGVDDMALGEEHDLPLFRAVVEDGCFVREAGSFAGMWFKDADREIIRDLTQRGLIYRVGTCEHSYPHNWRDDVPLMYYARETWFIRSTECRQALIDLNQTINWVPEHVRDGRFGNWLEDLKDWSLGRERYWGTPLPIWIDDSTGDMICVGSLAELEELAGRKLPELDLHRPWIDGITFANPNGGGTMRRTPEVIDVWFDSGAMPLAQWGYPHKGRVEFEGQFPADYICEAVDQTRGWFFALHAISSMLFEEVSFRNVICLGFILDHEGKKMSKSRGIVVDPWEVIESQGADAMRWYFYTAGPPGDNKRFSTEMVAEVVRKFWSTLWNTYSFLVTYANLDGWTPNSPRPAVEDRELLDRWVLSELHQTIQTVTEAYDNYDAPNATRPVQAFVEALSNWYVRLSRRRFWKNEQDTDKAGAYATLYECLVTVSQLIAPAMPFLSEAMYRNLVASDNAEAPPSVHLSRWPQVDPGVIRPALMDEMRLLRQLVSLGLAARNEAGIKVRQPLASAAFVLRPEADPNALEALSDLVHQELNVKQAAFFTADAQNLMHEVVRINPLPQLLGKKFGADFRLIQSALREGKQGDLRNHAASLLAGTPLNLQQDGREFEILPEEVEIHVSNEVPEGYVLAAEGGSAAILDVRLDQALREEGLAREVVRRVQNLRREADFRLNDRIAIRYRAEGELAEAIARFGDSICGETLCDQMERGDLDGDWLQAEFRIDSSRMLLGIKQLQQ